MGLELLSYVILPAQFLPQLTTPSLSLSPYPLYPLSLALSRHLCLYLSLPPSFSISNHPLSSRSLSAWCDVAWLPSSLPCLSNWGSGEISSLLDNTHTYTKADYTTGVLFYGPDCVCLMSTLAAVMNCSVLCTLISVLRRRIPVSSLQAQFINPFTHQDRVMTEEYLNLSVSHRSTSLTHQKPHARPHFLLIPASTTSTTLSLCPPPH